MATRRATPSAGHAGPDAVGGSGSSDAEALLAALEHPHREGIVRLRRCLLALDPRIAEGVKWNAPSYRIGDTHFATFRLHPPKHIQLVLHTDAGSKSNSRRFDVEDPEGLLKWPASDRCVLTLASTDALIAHEDAVLRIVRQWIGQL